MSDGNFRCRESFVFYKDGAPVIVGAGDIVNNTRDVRYKGHESFFEPLEEHINRQHTVPPVVEQATAEPGQKRAVPAPPAKPVPPGQRK